MFTNPDRGPLTRAYFMPESEDQARSAIDATLGAPAESSRNAKHI